MPHTLPLFSEIRKLVNSELEKLIPPDDGAANLLREAIRWSLLGEGKYFRPSLVFATGRSFGASDTMLVRTATAVEMLHTYSLIHDDLPSMDDDDLRRGRETCHKKFGEATAILAGDALQALSFQTIAEDPNLSPDIRLELITGLTRAAAQMVVGQQLDLESEGKRVSGEVLETIHRNKTGALIRFCADAGAIIGNAEAAERTIVSEFAEKLGLLFQIKDDLLDITQTTEQLGKTAGKDITSEKATFPSLRGIEESERLASEVHAEVISSISNLDRPAEDLTRIADFILERRS